MIRDPAATKTIAAKKQTSRIDYNVFEGFACRGLPRATIFARARCFRSMASCARKPATAAMCRARPTCAAHVANATWRELNAPRGVARADVTP